MKILACAFFVAAITPTQDVRPGSQPAAQTKQKAMTVTVRGCLQGTNLLLSEDPGFELPGHSLPLTGSRKIMRALKERNGRQEEIVGVLKTGSQTDSVAVKEKRGDKTRVYVGVSKEPAQSAEVIGASTSMDVREFKDLGPSCQ